ncbi:MAG TPA: DUF3185 family protein [Opitutales bacterium]|jgi:hypothetical protein|nr:DUF3185 family protein [Opitutales bacterium]
MNKATGLALFVVGIILVVFGMNATDSLSSDFSRFFTGAPTEKAIWLLIAGVVCSITGLVGIVRGGPPVKS